jgi:ribosomal protein S19
MATITPVIPKYAVMFYEKTKFKRNKEVREFLGMSIRVWSGGEFIEIEIRDSDIQKIQNSRNEKFKLIEYK